jgi:hypothetical protein
MPQSRITMRFSPLSPLPRDASGARGRKFESCRARGGYGLGGAGLVVQPSAQTARNAARSSRVRAARYAGSISSSDFGSK